MIDDFVFELGEGRTPNPCARCNGEIKFGAFLRRADELGIDLVATGHYVRSTRDADGYRLLPRRRPREGPELHAAHARPARAGPVAVPGRRASRSPQTRDLAERFGLPVASKPDSQELCFAPAGDAGGFLRSRAPAMVREGGQVVDVDGRVLAEHDGTFAFTVGQRRGLGVATGAPAYVLELDADANRVVVGAAELLAKRGLVADRVSWVGGAPPADGPFEAEVRIRYRGPDVPAVVTPDDGRVVVAFRTPQRAVAPGQSVVVYRGDELLGGGRIREATR